MSRNIKKTRNRILESTLNLLEAGDGNKVRMTDIAKGAGITRQALYLHFSTRAELLIATTYYLDEIKGIEARLHSSRTVPTGAERLDAYIEAWGGYIPEIYGLAKAFLAMKDTDEEAAKAWNQRMQDMREGCEAAINALDKDNRLLPDHTPEQATDILWTLLSVRNWEQMTMECGWSQERYILTLKAMAGRLFVAQSQS